MIRLPSRAGVVLALLATAALAGCAAAPAPAEMNYRGSSGEIRVGPDLERAFLTGSLLPSIRISPNGTNPPDVHLGEYLLFNYTTGATVFGPGGVGPAGVLTSPQLVAGKKAVHVGRGTFYTAWPEDLGSSIGGMGYLQGIAGWTWDAMYAIVEKDGSNGTALETHLILHRNAAAEGGLRFPMKQINQPLGGPTVQRTFLLDVPHLGSPATVVVRMGDNVGPSTELDVRLVSENQTLATKRLGGVGGATEATFEFVQTATTYELAVTGHTSGTTLTINGHARLDTPTLDLFWSLTTRVAPIGTTPR